MLMEHIANNNTRTEHNKQLVRPSPPSTPHPAAAPHPPSRHSRHSRHSSPASRPCVPAARLPRVLNSYAPS